MRAPAKPKPNPADEVARVFRIARWMEGEINAKGTSKISAEAYAILLQIAERIAARTTD